jgi:hypothetical protein
MDHENAEDSYSTGKSPNDEALHVLGHDVNRLVNLMDKLRKIGLKSLKNDLPELVLVGDQSVSIIPVLMRWSLITRACRLANHL